MATDVDETTNLCPAGRYNPTAPTYGCTSHPLYSACLGCGCCNPPIDGCPNGQTLAACVQCAAGTYSSTSGAESSATCIPCSAGSYSAAGASSCAFTASTCPVGTYANGTAACVPCFPATACTVPGLAAHPPCYWNVSTLAGNGVGGYANGVGGSASFNIPCGIALGPTGATAYVSDMSNNRVRAIALASRAVSTLAGSGSALFANGLGAAASFNAPRAVTCGASGNVYVADSANNRIRMILPSGLVSTVAGNGVAANVNGMGTSASIAAPNGVTIDSAGNLYVCSFNTRAQLGGARRAPCQRHHAAPL